MQLRIDWEVCVGSGACLDAAPRAFALVPYLGGVRAVLTGAAVDPAALREAAFGCPTLAIEIAEDGVRIYPPPSPPAGGS